MKLAPFANALPLALILVAAAPAAAQTRTDSGGTVVSGVYDLSNATHAALYCQITVTTSATNLASLWSAASCVSLPTSWGQYAVFHPEASGSSPPWPVVYRADRTAATPTVGMPLYGYTKDFVALLGNAGANAANVSLISTTGGNVTVDVEIRG